MRYEFIAGKDLYTFDKISSLKFNIPNEIYVDLVPAVVIFKSTINYCQHLWSKFYQLSSLLPPRLML